MNRTKLQDRALPGYSRAEELFNTISHIVGGVFALSALIVCVVVSALHQNVWGVVSSAIYGATMILLYTMSSIYHGLPVGLGKKVFQVIDHCAVYLLIAGTYTPITLVALREVSLVWGWVIFGVVWGSAVLGIVLNAIDLKKFRVFSMVCYVGTGWSIVIALPIALEALSAAALALILAGGVVYTGGAILYGLGKKHSYLHSVFHILVLMGSVLHGIAIFVFIL